MKFKKNHIITGPNASGKTTLLKSTIINVLLSQQIGYGYYSSARITPFHHIHCYMNIPDTNGRDSLFQAEARRCLEILTQIQNNKNDRHLLYLMNCIPVQILMKQSVVHIHIYTIFPKNKNIKFMLTTHFIKLCELLEKDNKRIKNYNMKTVINNDVPQYTYKINKGISTIKGGICVLKDLNYPEFIVEKTKNILKKI